MYTIKASLDGGTWATAIATVTVLKNAPSYADPAKDSIIKGGGITGSGPAADPFAVTAGGNFSLTVAGDTRNIPEDWSVNPSGSFPVGGPYTIKATINNPVSTP